MGKCEQKTMCSVRFITHFLVHRLCKVLIGKDLLIPQKEKKKIKKAGFLGQTFHKALDVHPLTGRLSTGRLLNLSLVSKCF